MEISCLLCKREVKLWISFFSRKILFATNDEATCCMDEEEEEEVLLNS